MLTLFASQTATVLLTASLTQVSLPRASPGASVSQTVGTTKIEIVYHRPQVKGRTIWSGLVPYGEVWRLGANDATTISLSGPTVIGGSDVPAGTYSLFAVPENDTWTFVLNDEAKQWGAFNYDKAKDQLRFTATPHAAPFAEFFTITMTPVGDDKVAVEFHWAHLAVDFTITADVTNQVWAELDAALAKDPGSVALHRSMARLAVQTSERLEQGLGHIEKALADKNNNWNLEVKAKLLWALGREAEAIDTMEAALEAAKGKAPEEFFRTRGGTLAGWKRRTAE